MVYRKKLLVIADLDRATLKSEASGEEFASASQVIANAVPSFSSEQMVDTLYRFREKGRTFDPFAYFEKHELNPRQIGMIMKAYVSGDYCEAEGRRDLVYPDARNLLARVDSSDEVDLIFLTRGKPKPQRVKMAREGLLSYPSIVVPTVQKGVYINEMYGSDGKLSLSLPGLSTRRYEQALFYDDLGSAHEGVNELCSRYCIERPEGGKVLPGGQLRLPGVVFIESLDEITHPALAS